MVGKNRTCLIITYRKETYRQVNLKGYIQREVLYFHQRLNGKILEVGKNTIIMNGR